MLLQFTFPFHTETLKTVQDQEDLKSSINQQIFENVQFLEVKNILLSGLCPSFHDHILQILSDIKNTQQISARQKTSEKRVNIPQLNKLINFTISILRELLNFIKKSQQNNGGSDIFVCIRSTRVIRSSNMGAMISLCSIHVFILACRLSTIYKTLIQILQKIIKKNPMQPTLSSTSTSAPPPSGQAQQSTQGSLVPQCPQPKQQNQGEVTQYQYAKLSGSSLQTRSIKTRSFYAKLFNNEQWDLSDRTFRDQDLNTAFKYIEQSKTTVLKLDYNKYPTIIKSISNTQFPNLINLYLGDNTIYSIELLSTIYMPNLVNLHLNDNPITQLKSLRKCYVPNLRMLSLRDIRIVSVNSLVGILELDCEDLGSVMLNYRDQNLCDRLWPWLKKTNWNYRAKKITQ